MIVSTQYFLKAFQHFTRFYALFIFGLVGFSITGHATSFHSEMEYRAFFSSTRNIFLTDPNLIKPLFFELTDISKISYSKRKGLEKKLFFCGTGTQLTSNCIIDRLFKERKAKRITRNISIPVQISQIQKRRYNSKKNLVTIRCKNNGSPMATMSKKEFMQFINIAEDSIFFRLKENIKTIKFNIVFQDKLPTLISRREANNLLNVYKTPPSDEKDIVHYRLDHHSFTQYLDTISFNLHFKAEIIKINNQTFRIEKENIFIAK